MSNTYGMGDIHGGYLALLQCLDRSGFDYENDTLIQLGDIADGWSQTYECVEELLKIKNLISIKGNHDDWTLTMMATGAHPGLPQGGRATLDSYLKYSQHDYSTGGIFYPEHHIKFFRNQHLYYVDDQNRCFVHGGFNRHFSIKEQYDPMIFYWDRDLWLAAMSFKATLKGNFKEPIKFKTKDNFKEIFIGHTSTINWSEHEENVTQGGIILQTNRIPITTPMNAANVWNLDTGAGFKGKLTIMNVDTKEYWQSDLLTDLYPNEEGRT